MSCQTLSPPFPFLVGNKGVLGEEIASTLLSSDLVKFDRETLPLDKYPILMLRTTLVFLVGLLRVCFSTVVFDAVVLIFSAGWVSVNMHLSSTGKSVIRTPSIW